MRSGSSKIRFLGMESALALGVIALTGCGSSSSGFAGDAGMQSDVLLLLLPDAGQGGSAGDATSGGGDAQGARKRSRTA